MKDTPHGPTQQIGGSDTNPSIKEVYRQLTELAEELDGWTLGVVQSDAYPPILGLHNFGSWESFEQSSMPMHVGILPTTESIYIVLPLTGRPVSVQMTHGNERDAPSNVDNLRIEWEFGSNDLNLIREAIANPLATIEGAVERVRHHCKNTG